MPDRRGAPHFPAGAVITFSPLVPEVKWQLVSYVDKPLPLETHVKDAWIRLLSAISHYRSVTDHSI